MDKTNHQDFLNKGPWYNISIFSKSHGSRFEDFITQERTHQYNRMCYLVDHDKFQLYYKDDEIIIGDREKSNEATIKTIRSIRCYF